MRFIFLSTFCLSLAIGASAQQASKPLPLNALIVSGGPNPNYNQYAIESNARYVEKLTSNATSRRILFADGSKTSQTISTIQAVPGQDAENILDWLLRLPKTTVKPIFRASTLNQIDGPATNESVKQNIDWLAGQAQNGQISLLYYTGHGSPGVKAGDPAQGGRGTQDFQNTVYSLWNNQKISVQETAQALKNWPQASPLVAVMVQCYSGGFSNLMFEDGDPTKPLLDRDFCGFYATIGERMASGCTSQVNETDYQDFTTHFFAALAGISRDGRKVSGADYDKNGKVSMLEAMSWTNLHDNSIDVPVCTSDAYLRDIFPQVDQTWAQTPYSQIVKAASPWQKATLEGLSKQLGLKGEDRVGGAMKTREAAQKVMSMGGTPYPNSRDAQEIQSVYDQLKTELNARFPDLKTPQDSATFGAAKQAALAYLATRKADMNELENALDQWGAANDAASVREAMAWRFVRASRTLFLEKRLQTEGTDAQKAAFAKLRTAESRNPLKS